MANKHPNGAPARKRARTTLRTLHGHQPGDTCADCRARAAAAAREWHHNTGTWTIAGHIREFDTLVTSLFA